MPFFSVIIPTYNSSATINRALESVVSQTFNDLEICIIDGSSKDNTVEVIKDYQLLDSRISFISEMDNGVYDAMNKGIKMAAGEYIFFLGSDDRLVNGNVFSEVNKAMEEKKFPDFIYGNVLWGESKYL